MCCGPVQFAPTPDIAGLVLDALMANYETAGTVGKAISDGATIAASNATVIATIAAAVPLSTI